MTQEAKNNQNKPKKIVVAGDVTLDWLESEVKAHEDCSDNTPNWKLYTGLNMTVRKGGALLLARMVKHACCKAEVISHKVAEPVENISKDEVIRSFVSIKKNEKDGAYRIDKFCGFAGPGESKEILRYVQNDIKGDDPDADIVILDDSGNGFRDADESAFPQAIKTEGKSPIVILKMSRPLLKGKLWEHLIKEHAKKLIVVLSADDLRECGMNISRRLSWERTAQDFVEQMPNTDIGHKLTALNHLIVRFDIEGAIYYNGSSSETMLYYDYQSCENAHKEMGIGKMQGLNCAFVAALCSELLNIDSEKLIPLEQPPNEGQKCENCDEYKKLVDEYVEKRDEKKKYLNENFGKAIKKGIESSQKIFKEGFIYRDINCDDLKKYPWDYEFSKKGLDYPVEKIFTGLEGKNIAEAPVPPFGYKPFWTILGSPQDKPVQVIACDIAEEDIDKSELNIPIARFGNFTTIDRAEIESYRSIKNLMLEYVNLNQKRPLSIAVFGPPGSGKSFGVKQIAKSMKAMEDREFNLSQFTTLEDLANAFHTVRDMVLDGKLPLIFFDEFDSEFNGKLGWLKYFLAPMQDGKFKDGETMHPIGKAIFVFAGGTSNTFEDFCCNKGNTNDFIDAKGPDFVSRLRGYINIVGINPLDKSDSFFMIRRAMVLRNCLKLAVKNIFDSHDKVSIDPSVLLAMLKVPEYKHGIRSMQAVIEMSMLSEQKTFEQAALPSLDQLEMHLDSKTFSRLLLYDAKLISKEPFKIEVAKAVHEKYLKDNDPTGDTWDKLSDDYKQSNIQFANQIPEKLYMIGYSLKKAIDGKPNVIKLSKEEIEELAQNEHERYVAEKLRNGWKFGPRDNVRKIHPLLKDWNKLSDDEQEKNRNMVIGIPEYIAKDGFEIYPLKEDK